MPQLHLSKKMLILVQKDFLLEECLWGRWILFGEYLWGRYVLFMYPKSAWNSDTLGSCPQVDWGYPHPEPFVISLFFLPLPLNPLQGESLQGEPLFTKRLCHNHVLKL